MLTDKSADQRAFLVALIGAVGVKTIQLRSAEDDRDFLLFMQRKCSGSAAASILKSPYFSIFIQLLQHFCSKRLCILHVFIVEAQAANLVSCCQIWAELRRRSIQAGAMEGATRRRTGDGGTGLATVGCRRGGTGISNPVY